MIMRRLNDSPAPAHEQQAMQIVRYSCVALCIVLAVSASCAEADARRFYFAESSVDVPNPDRGLFDQILLTDTFAFDFSKSSYRNHRVLISLKRYFASDITPSDLTSLAESLTQSAALGHRLIIRFLYDWPSEAVYRGNAQVRAAQTPSAEVMLRHVEQLSPALLRGSRAIVAIESGMVGFWGEQHGDDVVKQSPAMFSKLVSAWKSVGTTDGPLILFRYPSILKDYLGSMPQNREIGPRVGLWNDCIGAIDDAQVTRQAGSHSEVFEGETCQLPPKVDYSCLTLAPYIRSIQLSLLHENFYRPTIEHLKKENCFANIQMRLGYRFVLREFAVLDGGRRVTVKVENTGWSASQISRPLYLVYGERRIAALLDLAHVAPQRTVVREVALAAPIQMLQRIAVETDDGVRLANENGNVLFEP